MNQLNRLSTDEWKNKWQHLQALKYYLALKKHKLNALIRYITWVNLTMARHMKLGIKKHIVRFH